MNIRDKLKIIAGKDALMSPTTESQRLCKCINYLLTQYYMDVKDDKELTERYQRVVSCAKEILEDK